jgi:hypothetical protein
MKRQILFLFLLLTLAAGAALYSVNTGTTANDGTGDKLRTAFGKLNTNDTLLQAEIASASNSISLLAVGNDTTTSNGVMAELVTASNALRGYWVAADTVTSNALYGLIGEGGATLTQVTNTVSALALALSPPEGTRVAVSEFGKDGDLGFTMLDEDANPFLAMQFFGEGGGDPGFISINTNFNLKLPGTNGNAWILRDAASGRGAWGPVAAAATKIPANETATNLATMGSVILKDDLGGSGMSFYPTNTAGYKFLILSNENSHIHNSAYIFFGMGGGNLHSNCVATFGDVTNIHTALGGSPGGGASTSNNIPGAGSYWEAGTNFVCDTGATNLFRLLLTKASGVMLTNGIDGQTITLQVTQDGTGGWGLVTNQVGTCGAWDFGEVVTASVVSTNAGRTSYIRCQYWAASNRWDVLGNSWGH